MSSYTTNLQLFKYNTATDGKQVFSIDDAMNDNWDKIDAFAKAIKDLSNLSSVGEKRFTDINNELSQKLEAQVSLAQNGYIKFNNGLIIQFVSSENIQTVQLPITFSNTNYVVTFGVIYPRTNYGYYTITQKTTSSFILTLCLANLTQMSISIGY